LVDEAGNDHGYFSCFNIFLICFFQTSWVCVICKKKQELLLKTGGWFSPGNESQEDTAQTIESLLQDGGRRLSLQDNGPVRLNSSLGKSNSFDQHDRERGAFSPRSPRATQGVRRNPVSPRNNLQNYSGHNGYGTSRGLGTSPRPSPRTLPLTARPSLSDDDVESPPGSDYEDYAQDSRVGSTKGSNKKVSFRDGHDEYRPTGMRGNRAENSGRDPQQAVKVRGIE
jgi:hypothetical protein